VDELATLAKGQKKADSDKSLSQPGAAALLKVGVDNVKRTRALRESAPDLHDETKRGETTVGHAWKEARARKQVDHRQKRTPKMQALPEAKPLGRPLVGGCAGAAQ